MRRKSRLPRSRAWSRRPVRRVSSSRRSRCADSCDTSRRRSRRSGFRRNTRSSQVAPAPGKSSILDAITFALYGKTTRTDIQSVKLADVCRPNGYVRVAFRQGDERWEITRGFTTKKESYLEVTRDGEAGPGRKPGKERADC